MLLTRQKVVTTNMLLNTKLTMVTIKSNGGIHMLSLLVSYEFATKQWLLSEVK